MKIVMPMTGKGIAACSFAIGVMQVLEEKGVEIAYAFGKSGSAWACFLGSYLGGKGAEKFMHDHMDSIRDVYDFDFKSMFERKGFANHDDLTHRMKRIERSNPIRFPYSTYTTNFQTNLSHETRHTDQMNIPFIAASSSIGGIFEPLDGLYMDMGSIALMPASDVKAKYDELGADACLFLNLHPGRKFPRSDEEVKNATMGDYLGAYLEHGLVEQASKFYEDLNFAGMNVIELPIDDLSIGMGDFNDEAIAKGVASGRRVALAKLEGVA